MSMSNNERLKQIRELQLVELNLIQTFVDICKQEKLRYYMLGGTMLGAIRHKGFIPWDDDADFGMPRPDYEQFIKVASRYLSENVYVATHDNTDNYPFFVARLCTSKRKIGYIGNRGVSVSDVFIDIFPLDGLPDNLILNRLYQTKLLVLRWRNGMSKLGRDNQILLPGHWPWYKKMAIFICHHVVPLQKLLSQEKCYRALAEGMKKYPYESSKYLMNMVGGYKFRETFRKTVFGNGESYEFEGLQLNGPQDYHTYLTQLYGDYMMPPAESERNWHDTVMIEPSNSHTKKR